MQIYYMECRQTQYLGIYYGAILFILYVLHKEMA